MLYCGQTVESALRDDLLINPHHRYTQALIHSMPGFGGAIPHHKSRLNTLSGAIPSLEHLPIGCRLGPRCPYAQKEWLAAPSHDCTRRIIASHFCEEILTEA